MRAINIGDKVSFINESMDGVVTSVKPNGIIGVTIEDDFELDVKASDLVVTSSTVNKVADKINAPVAADMPKPEHAMKPELYWYMTDFKEGFNLHIANLRDYPFLFTCYRKGLLNLELVAEGKVEAGEYKKLMVLQGNDPKRWGSFEMQLLSIRNLPSVMPVPLRGELELNAQILQNPTAKKDGKPYWLISMNPEKIKPAQETKQEEKIVVEPLEFNIEKPSDIIDLHAEKLGLTGLEADQILKKQMEIFHKNLELAIAYKMPKMVFIHGVGTGVLKNLITLAVKGNKNIANIVQADFAKYGEGAVEVRLRG